MSDKFSEIFRRMAARQRKLEKPIPAKTPAKKTVPSKPVTKAKVLSVAEQERHRVRDIMQLPGDPAMKESLIESDVTVENAREILSWGKK